MGAVNQFLSKYGLILPATLLRGEALFFHLKRYRERQWISLSDLRCYQEERLHKLLRFSQANSKYYARVFKEVGADFSTTFSWEQFQLIPYLEKSFVAHSAGLLSTWQQFYASAKTTSGSTGQAVSIKKNPDAIARERAATFRAYEWAGIRLGDPQARFWGIPITRRRRLKSALTDIIANRLRISAFGTTKDSLKIAIERIRKFRPVYLYGYASMISLLAKHAREEKWKLPRSTICVVCTSEILTDSMRKEMQSAFDVPVFNEYGCGEVGSIAHECENGNLHLMSDNVYVECIDQSGKSSETGELVITDLHNFAMPLIRYRLADYASLSASPCSCGRTLPIIAGVHGRAYDIITSPDGRIFHPESVMYIFEKLKDEKGGIEQFQVIQKSANTLHVKIVVGEDHDSNIDAKIVSLIKANLSSDFHIEVARVDSIEREKSGKLRLVKSELDSN